MSPAFKDLSREERRQDLLERGSASLVLIRAWRADLQHALRRFPGVPVLVEQEREATALIAHVERKLEHLKSGAGGAA